MNSQDDFRTRLQPIATDDDSGEDFRTRLVPLNKAGALRGAGDTGLAIGRGLATGTQMVADAFGANNKVSRVARKIGEGLGNLRSDESKWETQAGAQRMDAAEASGSKWNEAVAGVKNFAAQPLDMAAEGIGSSVPTLATVAATRGRVNPLVTGAGAGAVQGAGAVKGQIYDDVKRRQIAAGLPEAEAEARAQEAQAYSGENADQIALGGGLGALAGTTGAESAVSRIIGHTGKSGVKPIIASGLAEGATEFAQGGQERLAANIASQREGFDEVDTWQGVVGQGTVEGLAGAGSGAAFGVGEAMAGQPEVKVDPNAGAISKALAQHPDVTPAAQAPIAPPPAQQATPIDPATTGQANYASVIERTPPMALDKAQSIADAMNADGTGFYAVAPHGNMGFTVVPTAWLTDDQLTSFASIQGDGGRLVAPDPSGILRVDANGNAIPESPEQAAEVAAIKQRFLDMGKPTPRGASPNEATIQKAAAKAPAIAAGIPRAIVETPAPRAIVETPAPRAIVEQPGPRGIVETVPPHAIVERPGPRGVVETAIPTIQGENNGATGQRPAAVAEEGSTGEGYRGGQGVPDVVAVPAGERLDQSAANDAPGSGGDLPAGTAPGGTGAVIARVGTTPNAAEPVTVRNGVVYVGEYPAQDFETGADITVPDGAGFDEVSAALRDGRVLSSKQRIYAGEKGAIPKKPPERRKDMARRQRVAEMDVETMRRELLTDTMTGLGNRRAYDESEKLPAQVSIDADSLKWVNDNLGHESGDKLLAAIGQALGDETANAYHISGDEFVVQAATEEEARAIMGRAVERMAGARIEATDTSGRAVTLNGVGVSYGIAGDMHEAERRLAQHKAEREQQGQRAARGETPPNAAFRGESGEDQPDSAAAEEEVAPPKPDAQTSTAPEHAAVGVDDRELGEIVREFNAAQARTVDDGQNVTHVFDAPAKGDIVRLADKAKVYHKDHGWMTPAEAKAKIAEWKDHARKQGAGRESYENGNANRVVLSLFDLTGKWSQPWEDAGYQVFRFDIQDDPDVGDVNNFSTEFFNDWFGSFDGMDVYAVLGACPCTDFASSGARHFAAKDADGRTVASVKLVHQTLNVIEYFKPAVWAIENPVGRIEKLGGLPPWRLSFDPNHLGDPYTKKTLLWGRFNADLPIAPVEPTEGSKMHSQYGGKSLATKNARSATPEGFAYGFFAANNAVDHPVMAIANKYDRLDRGLIQKAVDAGVTEAQISAAVDDFYYMDLDDDAANAAIRDLIPAKVEPAKADTGRQDGWRTNAIKARKVMRDLGIEADKGMKLADMLAAIDAHDANKAPAGDTNTESEQDAGDTTQAPKVRRAKKGDFATPEQEQERANLIRTIDLRGRLSRAKTADERRHDARKVAEAQKALKKLPAGMLTDSAILSLNGKPIAESPLIKVWVDGARIALDGANSADEAIADYKSNGGTYITEEYFQHQFAQMTAKPKADPKATKAAKAAKAKAERDLHVFAATDTDTLALAGTLELDGFIDGANAKIVAQIEAIAAEYAGAEADAIRELVQDGKPVLPRTFYESAYKDAKKAWDEQQKNAARDPEAYKEVLRWGLSVKDIAEGTDAATEYKAGFDHALKGKTRSTLPQDGRHAEGYDDARAWIKTEDGKAWFEGKPRQAKQTSTGEALKRVWDRARKGVDNVDATDKKAWEQILKSTQRAEFFPILLADDATPGAKEWLDKFRDKIATFSEYYMRVMVESSHDPRRRYGSKAIDVFTGSHRSYKGRLAERNGGDGRNSVKTDDETRLELTKEVAHEYQQHLSDLAQKFAGLKSMADIKKVIEDTYGQPDNYKVGTAGLDLPLYYENTTEIKRLFPPKQDDYYKYSRWGRLEEVENQESAQKDRKDTLIRPRLDKIVRKMPDSRNGKSVTAAELKKTFNFGDVTIGQYVTAQEAEDHLNYAHDALQSLALILGAKPEHLSFGGKLHFSIGALGHGKYAAHFQPAHPTESGKTVPVINVTKTRGDGAVLHEYFHAIDFMTTDPKLKSAIQNIKSLLVKMPRDPSGVVPMVEAFLQGRRKFNRMGRGATTFDHAEYALSYFRNEGDRTRFYSDALVLDNGSKDPYWSNQYEPWARAAEAWGLDRLLDSDQRDDYLQSDWAADGKVTAKTHRGTPYPQGDERRRLNGLMDEFVKAVEWTDAGPVLREGHAWQKEMPYEALMAKWNNALADAKANLKEIQRAMEGRLAAEQAERDAERERKEREAMFGAEPEAEPEIEQPTASSEPAGDVPMSEDELSAIFDEEAAATREATQEEPEAEAPGAKLDSMAWTKEDAKILLTLVDAGRIVLVADSSLGLPTIHDIKDAEHKGFGVFHVNTPEYEGNFTAGGAMDHLPSGKGYTTFSLTRGDAPFWNKGDVAAKLRVLAGEPGKSVIEQGQTAKAKRDGKDLPNLAAEQTKTASALAGEFAKHGVKGLENTLDGLVKLFGGGAGKLQSFPSGFDKDTYEQAKPLFKSAAEEFRKAGMSFKEFVRVFFRTLINQFGDGVKPYAIQFAKEYQEGYEQAETEQKAANEPIDSDRDPAAALSDWVLDKIKSNTAISWQDLFAQADKAYNGTQANGTYTPKDAYDAVELAVNRWIIDTMPEGSLKEIDADGARHQVQTFEKVLALLPTQSKRTKEMDEFQQFSTPPHFAFVANWVAALRYGETYLEPSAGVGGLAAFGRVARARVVVNEYSARRLALLRNLPFDAYYSENAEQLNNVMPDAERPTVIVMNPPFSATAGRIDGKRDTMNGAQHIEQALKFLQPGGRLVAIVGEGMGADKPAFAGWWNKIKKEYNVRANIGIDGSSYAKYGTTFDNQILVIDKSGATTGEVITGKVDHPADALQLLEAVRNDRPEATQSDGALAGRAGSDANAQGGGRVQDTGPSGPAVDPAMGGRGQRGTDGQGGADNGGTADAVGDGQTQGGRKDPVKSGKPGNGNAANADGSQDTAGNRPGRAGTGGTSRSDVTVETGSNAEAGEVTNSVFETYSPKKVRIPGAVPHNTPLVESSAMAAVTPPDPSYTPNLPKNIIEKGLLSDAQLETVVYAGQAHDQMLRDNETRRGFFLGDGTGVGKGRQISGIILDNFRQGRTKAVWLSKKKELIEDALRDFGDLGGDTKMIFPLAKIKHGGVIGAKEGILFAGYPAVRSQSRATAQKQKAAGGKKQKDDAGISFDRVRQIVEWLGKDFDGVIAFDEAHEMGNAVATKGKRGMTAVSDTALAGLELQKALPNARIVYVSATGATEVRNLAYAERLGLWGEGTPFENVQAFIGSMSKSVSAMELVAQNLKQMGLYMARSLSYDGIAYDKLEHQLSPYQRDTYDLLAESWQTVLNNIDEALKATGVMGEKEGGGSKAAGRESGKIKSGVMSAFWGSHQRFFNQIITASQMPSILESIEQDLKDGKSVVLQLTNTNEADQNRALAKAAGQKIDDDADEDSIEELDLTPREQLITLLEKAFPINQYEQHADPENPDIKRIRLVLDAKGNPVINKEMLAKRDQLIQNIRSIRIPDSPLQMLIDQFGADKVAEITGRGQRIVKDENGKMKVEKRGNPAVQSDAQAFKDGKKRILVFSQAGGTGFSFHSDKRYKNRQQRAHYIVQAGWSADKAVQGFGRTHRTNQENAPIYRLVMTDIPAHKRFISSIARRLEQLGALTAGQRDTAGGSLFSASDNLESPYATKAVRQFFESALNKSGAPEGFPSDLIKQMGLEGIIDEKTGGLNETKIPTTTQFLNRLLSLRLDTQEVVFDSFMGLLEQQIEMAKRLGSFDDGLQTIKHVGAEVVQENEVYRDPSTNSAVRYIEIKYKTPNTIYGFDAANGTLKANKRPAGWFKNKHSGRVAGVWETSQTTTNKQGVVEKMYGIWRTSGTSYEAASKYKPDGFERVKDDEARALWEAESAARPKTKEHALHMVVGGILPLWDRFNDDRVSVSRIGLDDGRRFLGREIFEKDLADTLNKLNVQSSAAKMTGAEIVASVMSGTAVHLSNGWSLKKVRVSNDARIEILTNGRFLNWGQAKQITDAGAITERIEWNDRYFVPTDKAKGGAVVDAMLQKFGANAVSLGGQDSETDGDTAFLRGTAGLTEAEAVKRLVRVQAVVNSIKAKWKNAPEIVVVNNMQDAKVPQRMRDMDAEMKSNGAEGEPRGFITGGKVYIVAGQNKSVEDVMTTVAHEVLGHAGLRGMFGDSLKPILRQIVNMRRAEVNAKVKEYGFDPESERDLLRAAEEVLANMAQTRPEMGFVKRAIAAIRTWLRGIGLNLRLTDDDIIARFILPARRFIESGGKPPTLIGPMREAFSRTGDPAFSRTVELRAAVSQRAADLLTTQKSFNGWWHKTVGTQYHKAQVDGDYRKAFDAVQNYLSGMAEFANGAADQADRLIPQLNSVRDLWNKKQPSPADIKAIAAPIFAGTLEDEKVYGGDELRSRFKLTDAQIDLYVQFRTAVDKSLDDLGKTDILRYAGSDATHLRDEVMAASTASRAAIKVAAHLNSIGKDDEAKAVMEKGDRVADLKAKGYAPLTRFGRYTVHVTEGDEQLYFSLFESEAEANAMARQMKQDNPGATVSQGVLSAESYKLFNGLSPDTLELFAGALGVEKNEIVQEYIKLAKSNRSAMKRLLKRKGIAGFSEDVPRILASFITSNARMAAANVYGSDMDQAAEAIPREKGDVKDEAIRMIEFARNPTEDAAKVRGLLFVQYIGGSVASAVVNMTQPITMSYPYLHQFSKSAGKELARAMKIAAAGGDLDADLKRALKRAEMDGVVSPQEIHQLQAEAVKKGAGIGALARMFGIKGEMAGRLDDISKRGLFAWGSMFSLAEQFNRRATFIAAYNIARQNNEADPFAFAEKAVVETQGIYNRGNRPDWARGAVGATVFTFKQYSISYMEFLRRLPPKERAIALAILVLAAGLQGIPFADDLDDLIDTLAQQMGYAWNTKAEKEKFAASILGQTGADFVLHGTSALPGVPLDFAARLGMSNLLPGTGILLKNKTDKAGEVFEVLGPAGGVMKDALRGEFMPLAVRNALKAADMANTGMYRDYSGKKVIETDGIDAAMKLIGFNPAAVAKEGRSARMDMQDVQLARNVESEIAEKMAQGVFSQDKEAVAEAREMLADWNRKNPDKPIVITSRQIMQRVKKMAQTRRERLIASAPKELRGGLVEP